jgi:hypothetical protein
MKFHKKLSEIALILSEASRQASVGGLASYLRGRPDVDLKKIRDEISRADKMLKELENEKHH